MKSSNLAICLLTVFIFSPSLFREPVLAQSVDSNTRDPLLPPFLNGELTPFRQRMLRESLDQLNKQAETLLKNKQPDQAFALWYREIKLRHYLGTKEEIQSLGRVGKIAWDNNRSQDIKIIISKLQEVQENLGTQKQLTPENLTLLLQAYQNVHSLDDLLVIQQMRLKLVEKNSPAEEEILEGIGEVYLAKFDYTQAAQIYESLVQNVESRSETLKESEYLAKLADIYEQNNQPQNAIINKEKLINTYTTNKQYDLLVNLLISIGHDYEELKNYPKASENYQNAFKLAWSLEYLGSSEEALTDLANLYSKNQQFDYALTTYNSLIAVQKKSYNYYGLMQTYNKIGDIYVNNKQYTIALNYFQEGLKLAQTLKYQVDFFEDKIKKVQDNKN